MEHFAGRRSWIQVANTAGHDRVGAAGVAAANLELAVGKGTGVDTVQVPVNLTSAGQVVMLQFDVSYDRELLSLQAVVPGSGLQSTHAVVANEVEGGQRVMVYNTSLQPIRQGLQSLVTLTFMVVPSAKPGQNCGLELHNVIVADASNNNLTAQMTLAGGRFTVPGPATGAGAASSTPPAGSPAANQQAGTVPPSTSTTVSPENSPDQDTAGETVDNTNNRGENTVKLADINGRWAEAQITRLVDRGAISGYPDGTFKPDKRITRAEFVKVLVQLLNFNVQSGKNFSDLPATRPGTVLTGRQQAA